MTNKETVIRKDVANLKLFITRNFDAPVAQVWKAWTESSLLDQWWAPKPWKAETKMMDFSEGGRWLYCMAGPDGTASWCRVDFKKILPYQSFTAADSFCDENGNENTDFPGMEWKTKFHETETGSKIEVEIAFTTEADMEKIIEMGFKEGFTAALVNLDELLAK